MQGIPSFGLIIPAAGYSSRMGQCKALASISPGLNFVQSVISAYDNIRVVQAVMIVNKDFPEEFALQGLSVIRNHNPERGLLHSVSLGAVSLPDTAWTFVHPVDHPLVEAATISQLAANRTDDYVIPCYDCQGGHPVLIGANVIHALRGCVDAIRFDTFLSSFQSYSLAVNDAGIIANCNTHEDLQHYKKMTQKNFPQT